MILDDWQVKILKTKGNIALRSGRQVGKSTIISIKAGEFAINNPNKTIMIVASTERQALLLFEKTLAYIHDNYKKEIMKGKDKPTKHRIKLKNGSVIHSLPTGLSGYGIRGYTVDLLIADEAAFIPEDVWQAVTPMLATTGGNIILLSTPFGKGGYFYNCFNDPTFTTFHISSEECPRRNEEFLEQEKKRMSSIQYAQEYLGEFVDELRQVFPDQLIKDCMTAKRSPKRRGEYYLGMDVGRLGGDESTFEIVERINKRLVQRENITLNFAVTTETAERAISLEKEWNFKKIYIDDGGIGAGVFDLLLRDELTRRKTIPINNASRPLTRDEKKKKKILKEDLYDNLLKLMEDKKIELLRDDEIFLSLRSVQYEYDKNTGKLKIFGKYTHIAEGLIRAAWCMKEKQLNIWIA